MNQQLLSYLRLAADKMPPQVAWPLTQRCSSIERMADLPPDIRITINQYLPNGMHIASPTQVV